MSTMHTKPIELFAIPFTCSLAAHIALVEAGLPHTVHWLPRVSDKRLADGTPYTRINPLGKVAALRLPDGSVVTENVVVLWTIEALTRGGSLGDAPQQRQLLQWLSFVATELHKQVLFPSFDALAPAETKRDALVRLLGPALAYVDSQLVGREVLVGDTFSVADCYLLWALILVRQLRYPLETTPHVDAYRKRLLQRPSVVAALDIERQAFAAAGVQQAS